jgi:DNA-binding transcriptional LysR family regulator
MNEELTRLRRLFLFDAACTTGGIGQAALHMGRSQPAVSLAIGKLEKSIGEALFERGHGGSELTPAGAILHRRVRRMLDQMERAVNGVLRGAPAGIERGTDRSSERASPSPGDAALSGRAGAVCRHFTDAQVRCLIAIAQCGSASGAAERLGVSQPAVHRAAREVEHTVGVALFRRRVHSVSANPVGAELARRLSLALHEITQASEDLAAARGQLVGRVAIGALPMLPHRLVARAAERLHRTFPAATLTLHEGSHSDLLRDLQNGAIDIIVGALREPRLDGSVTETALFADPLVVTVRAGHPLAGQAVISTGDLTHYDWVVPPRDMPRRDVIETIIATLPGRPRLIAETSSLSIMMAMLVETDCITLLSRSQISQAYPGSGVAALPLPALSASRTVGYTTRTDWLATAAQDAFILHLQHACSGVDVH